MKKDFIKENTFELHHVKKVVNSLPSNKFSDWSKLKAFAQDKCNAT